MSKNHTNRLHSLWPSHSSNDADPALPASKELAARLEPMLENVGAAIADHPRASLTVAATLGALLGWFIKRT